MEFMSKLSKFTEEYSFTIVFWVFLLILLAMVCGRAAGVIFLLSLLV